MDNPEKINCGILYGNTLKKALSHPDMTGFLNIEGEDWRISAWKYENDEGEQSWSLAIRRKSEELKKFTEKNFKRVVDGNH